MIIDFQQGSTGGDILVFTDWNFEDQTAALGTATSPTNYGTIFMRGGGTTAVALLGGAGPGFPSSAGASTSSILDENNATLLDENNLSILSDP